MKFLLFLATISSFLVIRINGYSGGAPAFKCNDMTPSHSGIQPDISTPPYTLLASSTTYKQGETITLTLRSTTGASFVGFMIAAKDRTTLSTIHGRFLNFAAGQVLNCGSSNAGSATHTNKQPRYTVQVQWQPTADTTGDVVFLATVVESYTVFWINIMTPEITEAPSVVFTTEPPTTTQKVTTTKVAETTTNPVTSTTTPVVVPQTTSTTTTTTNTITSTQVQLGKLLPDNECGATKGCFTKCSGQSCTYIVTWRDNVDTVDFELATTLTNTDNKWIGIAFSTDLKMGGDEVVACTNIGGNTDINRSYNDGKNNQAVGDPKIGLSNTAVSIQNGVFKCSFSKQKRIRRQKRQAANSLFVDLENDYNVMFGTGSAYIDSRTGSARNGMHSVNPDITPGKVDFQSFSYIGDTAKHPLVKIHACLMIIAWIFCTSIAIISARYYKPVWSKTSLFNQKVWFQIHRTLMVTAMALTVVAFIIIFVEVGGYSEVSASLGKEYLPAHPILGIIVTILCILNPIMSLFRPAPDDKKRQIFNWAHWGVGMAAQILAIITIIFGVELQKSTAPKYTVWVVVGFVIYYVLMEIIQKVVDRLLERKTEGHPDAVEMKQNGATITQPPAYSASDKNRKDTLLKKSLLALHVICTFAFTLTLLLLVSMY